MFGLVTRSLQSPLPPLELELLEDDEDDELDDELELLEEDELELEELLLDEDELEELDELDELLLPAQSAACGELPVTVNESMFARPPLVVATRLMLLAPAFRNTFALTTVQLVHAPVVGKSTLVTVPPFTCTFAGRLLEPFAYRHSSR
jgi:hypothetical protein